MSWLQPTDPNLLFTRNDKEDPRLGECVQVLTQESDLTSLRYDMAILGYSDDEGISLNGGRIGAKEAPNRIRQFLYKMTPHLQAKRLPQILDVGNINPGAGSLSERHEQGRQWVREICQKQKTWISFGGGHDYGYCDGAGFLDVHADQAVLINFDAHMDVRSPEKSLNSGTPFHRILNEFQGRVDFAEIGIQSQCNSRSHVEWAKAKGAEVFTLEQVESEGLQSVLKKYLRGKENKKIFLSIDIDAFTSNEAPGCSQSWTTGLATKEFLTTLDWLVTQFHVNGLAIYEVSPSLDQDNRTSKLAALIAHRFIFSSLGKMG